MTEVTQRVEVPAQRPAPVAPPERRGRLAITDRAAKHVACRVVRELAQVRDVNEREGLAWSHSSAAQVHGDHVRIRLFLTLEYPAPLRATAAMIRAHVAGRVTALTGLRVSKVDVIVTGLREAPS